MAGKGVFVTLALASYFISDIQSAKELCTVSVYTVTYSYYIYMPPYVPSISDCTDLLSTSPRMGGDRPLCTVCVLCVYWCILDVNCIRLSGDMWLCLVGDMWLCLVGCMCAP